MLRQVAAVVCGACLAACTAQSGQEITLPEMSDQTLAKVTSVKDQGLSGTCWAFGGLSFLESEIMRRGGAACDLAEMWVVRHAYKEKIVKYVRTKGRAEFSRGGTVQDALMIIDHYGIVPQEVYSCGVADGQYDHTILHHNVKNLAKRLVATKAYYHKGWMDEIDRALDRFMGACPEQFEVEGVTYTPKEYAAHLGLKKQDYMGIASYAHHPFHELFTLEIPDNWAAQRTLNLPLDSLMHTVDRALEAGVSLAFSSDVKEVGFSSGIAALPCKGQPFALPVKEEREVDQSLRQAMFDHQTTTDDHIMQLVGVARDPLGRKYYKVKNSWGTKQAYGGYWYMSPTYLAAKHIEILVPCAFLFPQKPTSEH